MSQKWLSDTVLRDLGVRTPASIAALFTRVRQSKIQAGVSVQG